MNDSSLTAGRTGLISEGADSRFDDYAVGWISGGGGSAPAITIDGQISPSNEWNYNALASAASGNSRTMKATNDSQYLYICLQGSSLNSYSHYDIFLDKNINQDDFLVEDGTLYKWNGSSWVSQGAISWSVGSTAIEIKIALSALGKSTGSVINLIAGFVDSSWNWQEALPRSGSGPAYTIK